MFNQYRQLDVFVNHTDFQSLFGKKVLCWTGTELAPGQGADGQPVIWHNKSIAYRQFFEIEILFADDTNVCVESGLDCNGEYFGLRFKLPSSKLALHEATVSDFVRTEILRNLPIGTIERIEERTDENNQVVFLTMVVEGVPIKMSSGFVSWDNGLVEVVQPEDFLLIEMSN